MKKHYCPVEKTNIEFEGQCNWCDEKEWQGLTDDEIGEAQPPIDVQMSMDEFMDTFARAIEAKLKDKNA